MDETALTPTGRLPAALHEANVAEAPDAALERLRARVAAATERGAPLVLRGGGTKDWYGQTPVGEVLDTRAYSGIVAYDPAELVITARCGTPLAHIEAALASNQQMLPFEPPHFGPGATLGGCIAAGLSGPRRASAGAPRDFVLGAVVMNGHGKALHFGGQVMKNVAGYDVARLMAGSLGTLGLILELSLKVLPLPVAESTLRFSMSATDAIRQLNEWGGLPLPISGSAWRDDTLSVRLEGAQAAVKAARITLGGEFIDAVEAIHFWQGLREHSDPFFSAAGAAKRALWRVAVPPISEALPLPGAQLIEWGGGQRWLHDGDGDAGPDRSGNRGGELSHLGSGSRGVDGDAAQRFGQTVREAARQAGGHATLFRGGAPALRALGVFTPVAAPVMSIQRGLKAAFDPACVFNRGRLYPDL